MEQLNIKASDDTPEIIYEQSEKRLSIKGNSFPENTFEFYEPVLAWLEAQLSKIGDQTFTLSIDITYYNSSSSKVLMNIFKLLDKKAAEAGKITINWYYDVEDEDSKEEGEEFGMGIKKAQFNILEKDA